MMWRWLFSKLTSVKNQLMRRKSHQSTDPERLLKEVKTLITTQFVKAVVGIYVIGEVVSEERKKVKEKQFLILGENGSGIDLVCTALLGNGHEGEQYTNQEAQTFNKRFGRSLRIKYSYLDVKTSPSANLLQPSDDYAVVYCFPISHRFTDKDLDVLKEYEKQDTIVAFTYSDRLKNTCTTNDYINNLPSKFHDFLEERGNKYIFISKPEKTSVKHQTNLDCLIKRDTTDVFKCELNFASFLFFSQPGINMLKPWI